MTTRVPPSAEGVDELAGLVYGVACWGTAWSDLLRLADQRIDVLVRARALALAALATDRADDGADELVAVVAPARAALDDALAMARLGELLRRDDDL